MFMRSIPKERDASFFKYKLLQIAVLLLIGIMIYLVNVIFDIEGCDQIEEKQKQELNKEDLKLHNILKKYLKPEDSKEDDSKK